MKGVSVCIPCYNQTSFLRQTLVSVLEQDYPHFELIVSDDSTTDEVQNLVGEFLSNSRVKIQYHRNIPSLGPAANWNACFHKSNFEWIKIMHHDDWFNTKDALSKFMAHTNDQVSFVFSSAISYNYQANSKSDHVPPSEFLKALDNNPSILFVHNLLGPPSSTLFRKISGVLFDERMKWLVDVDFYIRVLRNSEGRFKFIKETLITSVNHADHNVTNSSNNAETELYEYFLLYQKLKEIQWRNFEVDQRLLQLLDKYRIQSFIQLKPFLRDAVFTNEEFEELMSKRKPRNILSKIKSILKK